MARQDNSEGQLSKWVEFQAGHRTVPLLWKEKRSDMRLYYRLVSGGKWLLWPVGVSKEKDGKVLEKKKSRADRHI